MDLLKTIIMCWDTRLCVALANGQEPSNFQYRFVRFYYFNISSPNEEGYYKSNLVKQKIEINSRSFEVRDIFGLEKRLQGNSEEDKVTHFYCT